MLKNTMPKTTNPLPTRSEVIPAIRLGVRAAGAVISELALVAVLRVKYAITNRNTTVAIRSHVMGVFILDLFQVVSFSKCAHRRLTSC